MANDLSAEFKAFETRSADPARLRLAFGHACVQRVRHLLEDPAVTACLDVLTAYLDARVDRAALAQAATEAAALANHHQGSNSIDGVGHAAVSASYAVARALAGRAIEAADYAAYASVYGGGGHGAVGDPESFVPEKAWQLAALRSLAVEP